MIWRAIKLERDRLAAALERTQGVLIDYSEGRFESLVALGKIGNLAREALNPGDVNDDAK